MKYILIKDDLEKVLGSNIARMDIKDFEEVTGFDSKFINQIPSKKISIIGVKNEEKAKKYGEIISKDEASKIYNTEQDEEYIVVNDILMGANLSKSDIDFNLMLPEWSKQDELAFLYKNKISGIHKIDKKILK